MDFTLYILGRGEWTEKTYSPVVQGVCGPAVFHGHVSGGLLDAGELAAGEEGAVAHREVAARLVLLLVTPHHHLAARICITVTPPSGRNTY